MQQVMNVNRDNQINLLEQARAARSSANWFLLIQCLQQLVLEDIIQFGQSKASVDVETQATFLQAELVDLALAVLEAGDFHQRWDIAKLLPKLGQSAIAPLIEILEDEDADEEMRWFTARILGEYSHPEVITALVELLKTGGDEELIAMAAATLGQIGLPSVAALTELLTEENTRLLAVQTLSHIRRSETIAPLLSVVQDPQVNIRVAAIEALGSFHDPRIPDVLLNALDDLAPSVRAEAVRGLSFRPDLREELDLVSRLVPRLYDFNLEVCCSAVIALGRLGTDAAGAALFQVLNSAHTPSRLQIEAVRSLGRIETTTALDDLHSYLIKPISPSTATLWQEIVAVLGRVEQLALKARAAEILVEMLRLGYPATQHQSIKQAIALSLGQLGDVRALDLLIQLLADADIGVKLHAIAALKQLAPEAAYQRLEQLASAEISPELHQGVAIALAEWNHEKLLPDSGNLF